MRVHAPVILYNVANSYFFLHMYPETIEWCKKIVLQYPNEQTEALYLIACSYYSLFDLDNCLKYLAQIWTMNGNTFEDDYLNDKRFKHMFADIAMLNKRNHQKEKLLKKIIF